MARPPRFDNEQILDVALGLLADGGPREVTVAAIARALDAPSGSIYYRFASRDLLLAQLWLRTVAAFQDGYRASLKNAPSLAAALEAGVRFVLRWTRENGDSARLLLLYRRSDLLDDAWPDEVRDEAQRLRRQLNRTFSRMAGLGPERVDAELLRLAAVSIPQGAVVPFLRHGRAMPEGLDEAVVRAALAAIALE